MIELIFDQNDPFYIRPDGTLESKIEITPNSYEYFYIHNIDFLDSIDENVLSVMYDDNNDYWYLETGNLSTVFDMTEYHFTEHPNFTAIVKELKETLEFQNNNENGFMILHHVHDNKNDVIQTITVSNKDSNNVYEVIHYVDNKNHANDGFKIEKKK